MKIHYKGRYQQVQLAVEDANDILYTAKFYEAIKQCNQFECTDMTSEEISEILKKSILEIEVKIYTPRWRYSKALGYFVKSRPDNVYLNSRKLYRNTSSISNTIVHEYVHAVDNSIDTSEINFGHNCGTFENTAPYVIGNIAEIIIDGNTGNIASELMRFQPLDSIHCLTDMGEALSNEETLIEDLRIVES